MIYGVFYCLRFGNHFRNFLNRFRSRLLSALNQLITRARLAIYKRAEQVLI
ncbi:hypothetical protein C4K37_3566 [Pseudomonas chlororaphis subsp. piscium]|nr:hypothetical protein C4K37_3566 [Pseudomonas chlororaphis subsp. piscium]AZC44499.1 hypothetical protein C4K36_3575 [Pseudomonas chlororaphis subsp. piscium]